MLVRMIVPNLFTLSILKLPNKLDFSPTVFGKKIGHFIQERKSCVLEHCSLHLHCCSICSILKPFSVGAVDIGYLLAFGTFLGNSPIILPGGS
jgi:hypothetical protein